MAGLKWIATFKKFDQFFQVSPVYSGEIDRQKPDASLLFSGEIP